MPASKTRKLGTNKKKRQLGKADRPVELTLPSVDEDGENNVCLARRPGPQGLMRMGVLDSLDRLTGLVSLEHLQEGGDPSKAAAEIAKNGDDILAAMELIDKVVIACVVEPQVFAVPKNDDGSPAPRDPELLYIDDVDFEDKSFIMQWVMGGTADLERFRRESAELVGGVEA